ncbi:MAG: hypothetical protein WBV94_12750 [Blastocatellia bacterium]
MSVDKFIPKWTKKVVTDYGGRDPLGLSRLSDRLTDYLLTGIITTTDRARYYSFYCWALWHIYKENSPEKYQTFIDEFRRREAAMAIASLMNDPEMSLVGIKTVRIQVEAANDQETINCDFQVLPSNQLGGYGQYYGGCMYKLGLTYKLEDGIDRITEGDALYLAQCFHSAIENTPYIKRQLFRETEISQRDVFISKERLTLDALGEHFADEERKCLTELFFGFNKAAPDKSAILRRHTLAHLLHVVAEYEKQGSSVMKSDIDTHLVYPIYYYDALKLTHKKPVAYQPPKVLELCHSLWKQFCLHQFFIQAIEGLMYSLLEVLSGESAGLRPGEIVSSLLQPDFFATLKNLTGEQCEKPCELLAALNLYDVPDEEASLHLQKEISLLNELSESEILGLEMDSPESEASRSMLLLAIIYGKWRGIRDNIGFQDITAQVGSQLWVGVAFPYLDNWLDGEATWAEALQTALEVFVLSQHDRIRWERKRLDSCWMHREGESLVKDQDYQPRWRSSRHWNAVNILQDLGLLRTSNDGGISITADGEHILKKVTG